MTEADTISALAAVDQSDEGAYFMALYIAAHEAVVAVGNEPGPAETDIAGNHARRIKYRPDVIMRALSAVCASFVVQSGDFPGQKSKRLAADALRAQFVKDMAYFEGVVSQPGAGVPMPKGRPN